MTRSAVAAFCAALCAVLCLLGAPGAGADPVPITPALDPPTGPHAVGAVDLPLVDEDRADPWVPAERRRVMTTVFYPAAPGATGPRARYLGPALAARLDATVTPGLGLPPGRVDWARVDTHALGGVPALRAAEPLPVVLYSPGAFESRLHGTGLAVDLASHGYVVVAVDHTHETDVEFPTGLIERRVGSVDDPAQGRAQLRRMNEVRVADERFVLDALAGALPADLADVVDPARVAAIGHSAGGDAAVAAAAADARIAAAVDLDGFLAFDSQGAYPMPAAVDGVDVPVLLMGSLSSAQVPPPGRPVRWRLRSHTENPAWRSLWERSTGPRYEIGVPQGRHHVFVDHRALLPGLVAAGARPDVAAGLVGQLPDAVRAGSSIHAYVLAFLEQELRGRPQPLLDGPSPGHPDVVGPAVGGR